MVYLIIVFLAGCAHLTATIAIVLENKALIKDNYRLTKKNKSLRRKLDNETTKHWDANMQIALYDDELKSRR